MKKTFSVLTTLKNRHDAEKLASLLLEKRLIACAQISAPITSLYRWKGKLVQEEEVQLSLKTSDFLLETVKDFLIENHPYELPEIIALPIDNSIEAYLDWVHKEVE